MTKAINEQLTTFLADFFKITTEKEKTFLDSELTLPISNLIDNENILWLGAEYSPENLWSVVPVDSKKGKEYWEIFKKLIVFQINHKQKR